MYTYHFENHIPAYGSVEGPRQKQIPKLLSRRADLLSRRGDLLCRRGELLSREIEFSHVWF